MFAGNEIQSFAEPVSPKKVEGLQLVLLVLLVLLVGCQSIDTNDTNSIEYKQSAALANLAAPVASQPYGWNS